MIKITKNTFLSEVLENPGNGKILKKYSFPCLSCPFAKMEMDKLKIGEICQMYDIDIQELLKDLNRDKTKK